MIFIDLDSVFGDGWDDSIELTLSRAMLKAIPNSFGEGVVYESGGVVVEPDEEFSEAIESGINLITSALNE